MNPYSYQHEKMGEAIHYLMRPDLPFEKKLVAGMMEFEHAFHTSLPSDSGSTTSTRSRRSWGALDRGRSGPRLSRHFNAVRSSRRSGNSTAQSRAITTPMRLNDDRRHLNLSRCRGGNLARRRFASSILRLTAAASSTRPWGSSHRLLSAEIVRDRVARKKWGLVA